MSHKKKPGKGKKGGAKQSRSAKKARQERTNADSQEPISSWRRWLGDRGPVFRFVALFLVSMLLFWLATASSWVRATLFPAYLELNAQFSGAILRIFEQNIIVSGQSLSGRYALTIQRGCDAIEPSVLFLSGVLAFPATFRSKLPGILFGTLCLMLLNIVRIVSLYYIGVYYPGAFEFMHVQVWQAVFIFIAIFFWILWAAWALPKSKMTRHATIKTS